MREQRITLNLNQAAIEAALVDYVATMGISTEGKEIEVSLTAGRGANGFSADVSLISTNTKNGANVREKAVDPLVEAVVTPTKAAYSEPEVTEAAELEEVPEGRAEPEEDQEPEPKPSKKTSANLFGN